MTYLDGLVLDIDEGQRGKIAILPDGREVHESQIVLSQKGLDMMLQGYLCGRCLQDFTKIGVEAFPEECPVCHFHVKELQTEQIRRDFSGTQELGSRLSLSDEMARLGELWLPEP